MSFGIVAPRSNKHHIQAVFLRHTELPHTLVGFSIVARNIIEMSASPACTTAVIHSRHGKSRLNCIRRIVTMPDGIAERFHKLNNIILCGIIIPFSMCLISCANTGRKPCSRYFSHFFPSIHIITAGDGNVFIIFQFSPIRPTA